MNDLDSPQLRRSTFLLAAASAVVAACTTRRAEKPTLPSGPPSPATPSASVATVDTAAVRKAIAREISLIAGYGGAAAASSQSEVMLFRRHHEEHLAELRKWVDADAAATTVPRPPPSEPIRVTAALAALATAESAAADDGVAQSIELGPTPLSVLLAQIAANEAQHASFLRSLAPGGRP